MENKNSRKKRFMCKLVSATIATIWFVVLLSIVKNTALDVNNTAEDKQSTVESVGVNTTINNGTNIVDKNTDVEYVDDTEKVENASEEGSESKEGLSVKYVCSILFVFILMMLKMSDTEPIYR